MSRLLIKPLSGFYKGIIYITSHTIQDLSGVQGTCIVLRVSSCKSCIV